MQCQLFHKTDLLNFTMYALCSEALIASKQSPQKPVSYLVVDWVDDAWPGGEREAEADLSSGSCLSCWPTLERNQF